MLSVLQIRPDELNHWCQSLLEMASIVRSQWSSVTMEFGRFPTFRCINTHIQKWWYILISWFTLYCSLLISILACLCIVNTMFLFILLWLQNMKKKNHIYFSRLFESKLQPRSPSTHWATILHTIYKFISCMTILIFWLKFYRSLFQLTINQPWAM